MTAIKMEQFGGMLPAWDEHLLPDGQAAISKNGYLFSGALIGWRKPTLLFTLLSNTSKFAYRIPLDYTKTAMTDPSLWLEFADQDTNVLRSQVVDDQFDRYYFASPSQPPKYNTHDRIIAGSPAWLLGIPAPGCAPTVSVAGGGSDLVLGNQNTGGGAINLPGNIVMTIPITPTGATQIQDVQFSSQNADANAHFAAVVYEDNGAGAPGQLLNTGQIVTGIAAGTNQSAFVNPSGLLANQQYWIGIMTDSAETYLDDDGSGNNLSYFSNTFSNGPPATAPSGSSGQPSLLMFADCITQDVIEARTYVYTWVSAYSEEGPPSPPTTVNGWSNGVWDIGLYTPMASDMGVNRNITTVRIYRTITATTGGTVYYWLADVNVGTATYVDTAPDSSVALNSQLPSTNWFPPPSDLQGLVAMPNGMMVGWRSNEVWFCEPYFHHAWPPGYVITTEYKIIGMAVTNGALVVCTNATPYLITGNAPSTMAEQKCSLPFPCISRASVLGGDNAVTYMSPNGLIQVTQYGVSTNTTELWITREKWQQLTPQKYARAIYLASCYFCFGSVSPDGTNDSLAQTGFTIELDGDSQSFTIWPQPGGHRLGFDELSSPISTDIVNVMSDPWTGNGLLLSAGGIYLYDFTDPAPTIVPYTWRSKTYQQAAKNSYAAMKVFFTVPPNTPTQGTRSELPFADPSWNTLGPNQYGIIRVFADGNLVTTREIYSSGELLRIASGFKADNWFWEVTSRVYISNIQVATSAKELAHV